VKFERIPRSLTVFDISIISHNKYRIEKDENQQQKSNFNEESKKKEDSTE